MDEKKPLEVTPEQVPDEQAFYVVAAKYAGSEKIYLLNIYDILEGAISHKVADDMKKRILKITIPTQDV